MCPEEMRKHIIDTVEAADETMIEQLFWFLITEIENERW